MGLPIWLKPSKWQTHDGRSTADMVEAIGAGQTCLPTGDMIATGCGDSLAARGAIANIHPMPTRKRFPPFDPIPCRARNQAERFFSKLKNFHALDTRYDKREENYFASAQLASVHIWLRSYEA